MPERGRDEEKDKDKTRSRSRSVNKDKGKGRSRSKNKDAKSDDDPERGVPRIASGRRPGISTDAQSMRNVQKLSGKVVTKGSKSSSDLGFAAGSDKMSKTKSGPPLTNPADRRQGLEKQMSDNSDSMAMLMGLAKKKKNRARSGSDSSSDSSEGGAKDKKKKSGGLDLSDRPAKKSEDSSAGTGDEGQLNMSSLQYPKVKASKSSSSKDKNAFVSRPDLREVDQSVNLRDVEAAKYKRTGADTTRSKRSDFTDVSGSSQSSRETYSRNRANPYVKVSKRQQFFYGCKKCLKSIFSIKGILTMAVLAAAAAGVFIAVTKGGTSIQTSKLIVPVVRIMPWIAATVAVVLPQMLIIRVALPPIPTRETLVPIRIFGSLPARVRRRVVPVGQLPALPLDPPRPVLPAIPIPS